MKKKIGFLSILLALSLCAGCGKSITINHGSSQTKESTTETTTENVTSKTKEEKTIAPSKSEKATKESSVAKENRLKIQKNSSLDIKLTDSKFVKSDGKNIILFDVEFTNKGKNDISLSDEYKVAAFQNGKSANEDILYEGYNWSDEFEKFCTPLKRNESTTIRYACSLIDDSIVTIVVFDYDANVFFTEDISYKTTGDVPAKNAKTDFIYSGTRLSKDYTGDDIIFIKSQFTNGTDDIAIPANLYELTAYQNGISLEEAFIDLDLYDAGVATPYTYVLPGYTVEIEYGFKLSDRTNVTSDITNVDSKETSTHVIKLDGGEGIKKDNSFSTQAKLVKSQSFENNGKKYLLIAVDLYNGEDHAISFSYNYTINASQNNNSIYESYMLDTPEEFDSYSQYRNVKPGYKNTVYFIYELNDTSDVKIEIKDELSENILLSETITP